MKLKIILLGLLFICSTSAFSQEIEPTPIETQTSADSFSSDLAEVLGDLKPDTSIDLAGRGLEQCSKVTLQGLDKITGRVFTLDVPIGKQIQSGRLNIVVHQAYRTPSEEIPETLAFLEIHEEDPVSKGMVLLFQDWMYASSPAVSALDHPVYDVWVKEGT